MIKRIKENKKVVLLTKRVSGRCFDRQVYPEQVLGRVLAAERNGRVVKLNSGLSRLVGLLYARLSVHSIPWTYPILRRLRQAIWYLR